MFTATPTQRVVLHGEMMTLSFYPDPMIQHSKFCVVVSKKIHKLATDRNRAKRITYEALRSKEAELDEYFQGKIVLSLRKSAQVFSLPSLLRDLDHIILQRKK